jgi:cytochrome c-type biogenesis protein CcmH
VRLAAKLEQEPENLEGWKMLAQSYLILERPAEARAALREGMAQFPHDPDLILTTARLEVLLAQEAQGPRVRRPQKSTSAQEEAQGASENAALPGGDAMPRIPPEAAHLFRRLLTIMPDHGEALWMVGLAEVQAGNRDKALELWRRLLSDIAEDSESHTMLEGYIRALEK